MIKWNELSSSPWLQVEICGSPSNSFSLSPTQQCEGEQAVLLESLFKESDSRGPRPLLPQPMSGRHVPHTHTHAGPASSPYKAKECRGCSSLLPRTLLGMLGEKAEMTGTTIRLPYLERGKHRAQTSRGGSGNKGRELWADAEPAVFVLGLWLSLHRQLAGHPWGTPSIMLWS